MTQPLVTVAIVSEFEVIVRGVADALADFGDRIRLVGTVTAGTPLQHHPIDVVLYDTYGHRGTEVQTLRSLTQDPLIRHVALFASDLPAALVRDARLAGVRAFISKGLSAASLADAIGVAAAGRELDTITPPPPQIVRSSSWPGRDEGLSERESQVLLLCAEGLSNRQIADALFINVETVKSHLKRVYGRLGLQNRAQAATYVLRTGVVPASRPVVAAGRGASVGPGVRTLPTGTDLAGQLGVDDVEIAERLRLLGVTRRDRARLARFGPVAARGASVFITRLFDRFRAEPELSSLLIDDATIERLSAHHRRYLSDLFMGRLDSARVVRLGQIGASHHRIRLTPQWFLATYAHFVCDHLDVIFDGSDNDRDAIETVITLLNSVIFDAGLVLDAYALEVTKDLGRAVEVPEPAADAAETGSAESPAEHGPQPRRPLVRVPLTRRESDARRAFLGIDAGQIERLHHLEPVISAAVPAVLDDFYGLLQQLPTLAPLVASETVPRLLDQLATYWQEFASSEFDRIHAASRMRVGVIHERIGLAPQHYLAGVARQVGGLLRALERPDADLRAEVDVILRAVLFDVTFVIDAYMEARADALLQAGRFATQLIAGMANGVAIVDPRDRVEHANEQLLTMVGIPAGLLHRMPAEHALPFPGINQLLAATRRSGSGRVTTMHFMRGRRFRVTGIRLEPAPTGPTGMVAVVVDDISDVIRASAQVEHDERRFDHIVSAIDAVIWEIDPISLMVLAVSAPVERLIGIRDTDLLGRTTWIDSIPEPDRELVIASLRSFGPDHSIAETVRIHHRMCHLDGRVIDVLSSVVVFGDATGAAAVCGLTVELGG